ncbi:YceD family protein [Legionella birminghamensis]|nr:YceD family protein [Legionella birminghamensis]
MLINLKKHPEYKEYQKASIELTERLPPHIQPPCHLTCQFKIGFCQYYYLLSMTVSGNIQVICQRCLNEFSHEYVNSTELALCASEAIAEKLMADFESVVYEKEEIDLRELVTDELYLYSPTTHEDIHECNSDIKQYLEISE